MNTPVTPLAIEMMMRFATQVDAFSIEQRTAEACLETRTWFTENGLIEFNQWDAPATEKGRAWLTMICATPLPKQKWIDPRFELADSKEPTQ